MTLTLLLDLDDTLLETGTDRFIREYLSKLGTYLSGITGVPNEEILHHLMAATHAMVQNRRPDITLKNAFDAVFYPALGFSEKDLSPYIDEFYREIYPTLREITTQVPGASQVVENALKKGWRIAIATNPLFPETAVHQRLEWAGLSAEDYQFDFLGSYEHMHYAKPTPAYFSEVLARLGCPETPVIVVGNDLTNDIIPAQQAGLAGYLVVTTGFQPPADISSIQTGSLAGLIPWIESTEPDTFCPNNSSVSSILSQMYATPAALETMTRILDDEAWSRRIDPGEWNLTEILCHLRDVECEVNLPRLATLEAEENPFIAAQDTDRWADQRGYSWQNGSLALKEFTTARREVLALIERFGQDFWQRSIRHAIFGPTTVQELFCFAATHDRLHIQQAYKLISPPAE